MNLYEIANELKAIENSGLEGQCLTDTLEGVEMAFNQKAENLIKHTKNVEQSVNALDAEIKRLQARKKAKQNHIDQLKDYLRTNMEASGIDKIECDLFTITLRQSGGQKLVLESENSVPQSYWRVVEQIDKTAIKNDLLMGVEVKGAHLEDSQRALIIK